MPQEHRPEWAIGKSPDETLFIWEFIHRHDLCYYKGRFYDIRGCIRNEEPLRQEIYRLIKQHYYTNLPAKVDSMLAAMRLELHCDHIHREENLIHVSNGTVDIDKDFYQHKHICAHRLPVRYDPENFDLTNWNKFLGELLEPEDILTLQEFMGYCLIPTNAAQKMLLLIGEGGEGKSRIGVVMRAMLAEAMRSGSLSKLEQNRFAMADLEDTLLMVDDDLKLEALNSTNHIKSVITADVPMDLERKGEQSHQGRLYCRFLAFGNGSLRALHDRSYGFFRRQIILTVKPRPADRVDDPFLGKKLEEEINSIFLWALEGLQRLKANHFQFTISEKARQNWQEAVVEGNNMVDFMDSDGYIRLDPAACASSRQLYGRYCDWCRDNALRPLSQRSFSDYLIRNGHRYGLAYTTHVPIPGGKRVRGYFGITVEAER